MKRQYTLYNQPVEVDLEEGLVRISNNGCLARLMVTQHERSTASLVDLIQADHLAQYGRGLEISTDSLVMEIWGHIYFGYILLKYKKLMRFIFLFGLYNRFLRSCVVIDCGEQGKDPNRKLWDLLTPFRNWVGRRLAKADLLRFPYGEKTTK